MEIKVYTNKDIKNRIKNLNDWVKETISIKKKNVNELSGKAGLHVFKNKKEEERNSELISELENDIRKLNQFQSSFKLLERNVLEEPNNYKELLKNEAQSELLNGYNSYIINVIDDLKSFLNSNNFESAGEALDILASLANNKNTIANKTLEANDINKSYIFASWELFKVYNSKYSQILELKKKYKSKKSELSKSNDREHDKIILEEMLRIINQIDNTFKELNEKKNTYQEKISSLKSDIDNYIETNTVEKINNMLEPVSLYISGNNINLLEE